MKLHTSLRGRVLEAALAVAPLVALGAGAAWSQTAAVQPDANGYIPQATIVEIMDSMVMPAAQGLWDAVAVDVTEHGTIEKTPQTDEDWAKLRATAVTLAEATNALVVPGRHAAPPGTVSANPDSELTPDKIDALLAMERPAWIAHAHVLHEAAMEALRAVDARSVDAISEAGGTIDAACEGCHLQFWYPEQPQRLRRAGSVRFRQVLDGDVFEESVAEVVLEIEQKLIVLLADVFGELGAFEPLDVPRDGPRLRIRARVVDRGFVVQRVAIRPRDSLDGGAARRCASCR